MYLTCEDCYYHIELKYNCSGGGPCKDFRTSGEYEEANN